MIKIRLAKIVDITYLVKLDQESSLTPWSYDNYLSSLNNTKHNIYLLEKSNQIIGAIVIANAADEAEILQLWIKKAFQHSGHGRTLLQYAIDMLKKDGRTQIFLEVRSDNYVAIRLYTNLGFIQVGKRDNYYKVDGWQFDAIIMLKKL